MNRIDDSSRVLSDVWVSATLDLMFGPLELFSEEAEGVGLSSRRTTLVMVLSAVVFWIGTLDLAWFGRPFPIVEFLELVFSVQLMPGISKHFGCPIIQRVGSAVTKLEFECVKSELWQCHWSY